MPEQTDTDRINAVQAKLAPRPLAQALWDILYEQGNLGVVLDSLEDQLGLHEPEPPTSLALYRFFSTERDEPHEILAKPSMFNHYLRYDGREYRYSGSTAPEDVPAGYDPICSWDFGEILVRSFGPSLEHPARCIVCNEPFPFHSIRCGAAA